MTPRIHGLTVCVDYADHLAYSLPLWLPDLASLMVVTAYADHDTEAVCAYYGRQIPTPLTLYRTDAFTLHGATFNKGLAMEEARQHMPWEDWILFFDADIVPPTNWRLGLGDLQLGYLYGCWRYSPPSYVREPDDCVGYGYFQLFHSRDPKVQHTPLLETCWRHAGNYDSAFLLSFRSMVKALPIPLVHLGERGHWWGRERPRATAEMLARRAGLGIHPSERLP